MTKKSFFIILGVFVLLVIGLSIAVILNPNKQKEEPIHYSDEYLYYSERFIFEKYNSENLGEYYAILRVREDYQNQNRIDIPNTIDGIPVCKMIGDQKNFDSYKNIKIVGIPENVIYIGTNINDDGILYGGSLADSPFIAYGSETVSIDVDTNNKVYASNEGILFNKNYTVLIRYPAMKGGTGAVLKYTIPETVTTVYDRAFYNNKLLNTIVLSSGTKSIGKEAFYDCEGLRVVTFNNEITSIGDSAFSRTAVQSIDIPTSVTSIGARAFAYCEDLRTISIDKYVSNVGSNVFSGTKNLTIYVEDSYVDTFTTILSDAMSLNILTIKAKSEYKEN